VELLAAVFFDLSVIVSMMVLAYLSKKMGEALKIPPYYLVFYCAALVVAAASGIDIAAKGHLIATHQFLSGGMRCCAGLAACGVSLRYWSWLFSEFFGG
jgi:hypothetical protein